MREVLDCTVGVACKQRRLAQCRGERRARLDMRIVRADPSERFAARSGLRGMAVTRKLRGRPAQRRDEARRLDVGENLEQPPAAIRRGIDVSTFCVQAAERRRTLPAAGLASCGLEAHGLGEERSRLPCPPARRLDTSPGDRCVTVREAERVRHGVHVAAQVDGVIPLAALPQDERKTADAELPRRLTSARLAVLDRLFERRAGGVGIA